MADDKNKGGNASTATAAKPSTNGSHAPEIEEAGKLGPRAIQSMLRRSATAATMAACYGHNIETRLARFYDDPDQRDLAIAIAKGLQTIIKKPTDAKDTVAVYDYGKDQQLINISQSAADLLNMVGLNETPRKAKRRPKADAAAK